MALLHPPNVLAARTAAHPSGEFHNSVLRFYLFCLFRRYPSANVIIERLDDERGRREIPPGHKAQPRSEEHTSELQSLMRISYAVFCLTKKNRKKTTKRQSAAKTLAKKE